MGFPVLISVDGRGWGHACSLCRDFVHFLQSLFLDSLSLMRNLTRPRRSSSRVEDSLTLSDIARFTVFSQLANLLDHPQLAAEWTSVGTASPNPINWSRDQKSNRPVETTKAERLNYNGYSQNSPRAITPRLHHPPHLPTNRSLNNPRSNSTRHRQCPLYRRTHNFTICTSTPCPPSNMALH